MRGVIESYYINREGWGQGGVDGVGLYLTLLVLFCILLLMKGSFPRAIEQAVEDHLKSDKVSVITGMRRVGKTTLMKRIFGKVKSENKRWFDFDNPLEVKLFEELDYNQIIDKLELDKTVKMWVFIDEVQNFPEVSKMMKYLVDHYKIKFVVTGSASYYLKNLFPESLAGRKHIFELFPLSFEEFLVFKGVDYRVLKNFKMKAGVRTRVEYEKFSRLFEEYLRFGGFPEVVKEERVREKQNWLKDIFSSYYEKEVLGLADFRKNKEVRDLMILLSQRVGSRLSVTRLSQELGVQRVTVMNYLQFLEDTYFISLIPAYSKSVDREIAGQKKVYLCDNGIASVIGQQSIGQRLENGVFNLLKFYGKVSYYQRRRSGLEIDFVVDGKIGFEVKETGVKLDIRQLSKLSKNLGLEEFYLVSRNFTGELKPVIYPQFL